MECSIEGCQRAALARTWCGTHYQRWRVTGTTDEPVRPTDLERYVSKCAPPDERDCRLWTAGVSSDGYGRFQTGPNGQQTHWRAHRFGFIALVGPIPEGLAVCHSCDTPLCQSPEHWWLGTSQQNTADKMAKGRYACPIGSQRWNATLDEHAVREMRALYEAGGISMRELGRRFGVSQEAARLAVRRINWAHVV